MTNSAFGHKLTLYLLVSSLMLTSGCSAIRTTHEESMLMEASRLTKLSSAVEATVRYEPDVNTLSEVEILQQATAHDPTLLNSFQHRLLRVKVEDRHALVLVCTKDGHQGLIEDAGCSAAADKHLWMSSSAPCEFTLQVTEVCLSPPSPR